MFRILSFTLNKHRILQDIEFKLTNPDELNTSNYYSVIIGPNGTGKSFLLKGIVEVFNEIVLWLNHGVKIKNKFTIDYIINDSRYLISNNSSETIVRKNGNLIAPEKIEIPSKILASSVTINDKYPILSPKRKVQIPNYHYLGVRSASNNAFISRLTINTVNYLVLALRNGKSSQLNNIYKSLSLNPKVQIVFSGGTMLKLKKDFGTLRMYDSPTDIIKPHFEFLEKNQNKTSYRVDGYKKYLKEKQLIENIHKYLVLNKENFSKSSKSSISLKYIIDFSNTESIQRLLEDWGLLSVMIKLELIKIKRFIITKDTPFQYEEASSGESHLLTSLHGILANLEDNSLLVIDEPEISLHPNWQIDYFEILKLLVNSYQGVHVIIATHSNLIVSSLKNEESRILSIKRIPDVKGIKVSELDFETYGREPENILYNIFNVATTRNKYFELDLRKLSSLISNKSDDKKEIKRLTKKLRPYIMDDLEDPLILLINQADKYINS